jgi:hypothetical protein
LRSLIAMIGLDLPLDRMLLVNTSAGSIVGCHHRVVIGLGLQIRCARS